MTCQCNGQGLLRIRYETGEPDDVAMCACPRGRWFRKAGPDVVKAHLRLGVDQRVAWLEDFEDGQAATAPADDYRAAGAARRRAKL